MGTGERTRQPRWEIADVLARTDLSQLLDELATPATHNIRGRRWHCPMPDHDDQHASVTLHTDHRGHERWRCWSGDHTHRGDAIDLIVATQRTTRADAIAWLANRAGMIPDQPLPPARRKPQRARPNVVPLDPSVVRYVHACEKILWGHTGAPVRDWLHARGFEDDLLRANHVGADPGRSMMSRQRGLPHGHSLAATFPALDPDGHVQYVQARYLKPIGSDKYDNPASSLGSNPRLAWTRTPDDRTTPGVLLVTEGIPDALTAAGAGYAAVGILGSQAPDDRVADVLVGRTRHVDQRIIAVIDADPAGRAWGDHLSDLLETRGTVLDIAEPPNDLDLNTWARLDPGWMNVLQSDVHLSRSRSDLMPSSTARSVHDVLDD
jgi:hypothetical protein